VTAGLAGVKVSEINFIFQGYFLFSEMLIEIPAEMN
jgi:hypothetical protein